MTGRFLLHHGDDHRGVRDARRAAVGVDAEVLDDGDDTAVVAAAVAAVSVPALFGGPRKVVAVLGDGPTKGQARALLDAWARSDAIVVVEVAKLPAKPIRELIGQAGGSCVRFDTPTAKTAAGWVADTAAAAGVAVTGPVRAALTERAGSDPDRVRSVLTLLAAAGYTEPTVEQVRLLAGDAATVPKPWDVTDAVEAGRVSDALDLADRLDPVPVAGQLARAALAVAVAAQADAGADVAGLAGVPAFKADALRRRASQAAGPGELARFALATELGARSRDGRDRVRVAIVRYAQLLGR